MGIAAIVLPSMCFTGPLSNLPWTRESKSGPEEGSCDASQERPISPTVSAVEMKNPMRIGKKYSGAKPRKPNGFGSLFLRGVPIAVLLPRGCKLQASVASSPSLASHEVTLFCLILRQQRNNHTKPECATAQQSPAIFESNSRTPSQRAPPSALRMETQLW